MFKGKSTHLFFCVVRKWKHYPNLNLLQKTIKWAGIPPALWPTGGLEVAAAHIPPIPTNSLKGGVYPSLFSLPVDLKPTLQWWAAGPFSTFSRFRTPSIFHLFPLPPFK